MTSRKKEQNNTFEKNGMDWDMTKTPVFVTSKNNHIFLYFASSTKTTNHSFCLKMTLITISICLWFLFNDNNLLFALILIFFSCITNNVFHSFSNCYLLSSVRYPWHAINVSYPSMSNCMRKHKMANIRIIDFWIVSLAKILLVLPRSAIYCILDENWGSENHT